MNIPNFTYLDCKIKIKNVRSHYCQELKKIRNSVFKDSSNLYKPSLLWFDALDSYLRDYVAHKPEPDHGILHIELPSFKNEVQEHPDEYSPPLLSPPSPATSASFERPPSSASNLHSASASVTSKRKRQAEYPCEDAQEHASASSGYKKSEFEIFGESVAAQLSSMPFVDALKLQLKIQELITRERLKTLNSGNEF
ncbi:unnamed protein product [Callosobruchus maculatus]|uniref:MADF domain-containing protein n=1 Tax=Callosobruchus maculatus TaxID=64391 RepID=A0A653DDQ8_CALMS|nr:unnamed protein product [Callosobruchus maculatus]